MAVAASDGRFEGWTETRGDCQNMSIEVSKSVIRTEKLVSEQGVIPRMPLKTLSLFPKGI